CLGRKAHAGEVCRHTSPRLARGRARTILERQSGVRSRRRRALRPIVPAERHGRSGGLGASGRQAATQRAGGDGAAVRADAAALAAPGRGGGLGAVDAAAGGGGARAAGAGGRAVTHPSLALTGVSKSYGSVHALNDISLQASAGERLALVGHNGAGKTTLFKLLLSILRPDRGEIQVLGKSPQAARAAGSIGFLPETIAFDPAMRGIEALRFWARLK